MTVIKLETNSDISAGYSMCTYSERVGISGWSVGRGWVSGWEAGACEDGRMIFARMGGGL